VRGSGWACDLSTEVTSGYHISKPYFGALNLTNPEKKVGKTWFGRLLGEYIIMV
jgi:hypothetical protein